MGFLLDLLLTPEQREIDRMRKKREQRNLKNEATRLKWVEGLPDVACLATERQIKHLEDDKKNLERQIEYLEDDKKDLKRLYKLLKKDNEKLKDAIDELKNRKILIN